MASYQDQIQSAFNSNTAAGKTPEQVYNALKTRLAANPSALNILNSYYTARNTPTPTASTTPTLTTPNNAVATKAVAPMKTTVPDTSGSAVSGSGLETGTKNQLNDQLSVINKQYDDKIQSHTDYANRVNDTYGAYQAELAPKYQQMRDQTNAMEKEMTSNYAKLKDAVATNYQTGMDSYARNAAAAQARVSGSLSASGIGGDMLTAAVSDAQYDPKRLAAIQSLKDKQISDLTNLQQNYTNWANNILQNNSNITAAEKQLANEVLQRRDKLDAELNDLKNSSIEDTYKPVLSTVGAKTDALATGEKINAQQNQTLQQYTEATPARKKDMLRYKLGQEGTDIGFIDETMLNEALKRGTYPEALAYLSAEAKRKANEAATTLSNSGKSSTSSSGVAGGSTTTPNPYSASTTTPGTSTQSKTDANRAKALTKSVPELQAEIDAAARAGESMEKLKATATAWGLAPEVMSQLNFTGTSVASNSGRKNTSSFEEIKNLVNSGAFAMEANTATQLLNKIGNKAVPSNLKSVVAKLYVKSLGIIDNAKLEQEIFKRAEEILAKSGLATDMMTAGDDIIKKAATKALSIQGLPIAERTLLSKIVQFGGKALPVLGKAGSLGAKVLGGPFSVALGLGQVQGQSGGDAYEVTDNVRNIVAKYKPSILIGNVNIPANEIDMLSESEKSALANKIALMRPNLSAN